MTMILGRHPVLLWLGVYTLIYSYNAFSGVPHKSKEHCWGSFAENESRACEFYSQKTAEGLWVLRANIHIPVEIIINSWTERDRRLYLYAVFGTLRENEFEEKSMFFDVGLRGDSPDNSVLQFSAVPRNSVRDYSHYDLIFHPLDERGVPTHFEGRWGSPSLTIYKRLKKETTIFDCTLDTSGHKEKMIMHCWYQEEDRRPAIEILPTNPRVRTDKCCLVM